MSFENLFDALSNLPVAQIADEVTASVLAGSATSLSSATGSGKTLYQTAKLATALDEQVVVLVPRRFLAVNAAETVAELSGFEVGGVVGYAVGSQTGDRSCWGSETKLLFATYGYALASGLVQKATTFVLDEVHETVMDLSIIRALLHKRMSGGESIRLLEMSATMDTRRQAAYWSGVAKTKTFAVEGKTFDCDVRHMPAGNVVDETMALIEEGRRGILVFRPGVSEVEETAKQINERAVNAGVKVQVTQIYGEMDYAERREAVAPATDGSVRVLVGTNVIESGANIPWVDAGVSCGAGKINSVRLGTGATYLELIDLPRWRLTQQEGRVKRFQDGVFVLCSPKAFSEREQATRPEIERLALTELVLHCAGFGLRTHELTFDYAPDPEKVREAELKLQRLGLITEDCQLTEGGTWIAGMPVGPETGAMLWHARQTDCLPAMLPLAAVIEVGGLRKEFRWGHYQDSSSDFLDSLAAFKEAVAVSGKERRKVIERLNIGYKRFEAARDFLCDFERRTGTASDLSIGSATDRLRQCLLAGSLDKLFVPDGFRGEVASVKSRYMRYRIGQGSVVSYLDRSSVVAGDLRVITPRDQWKEPFTVLEKVSVFSLDDLRTVAAIRPGLLVEERSKGVNYDYLTLKLFGEHVIKQETVPAVDKRDGMSFDSERPRTLGDILAAQG